MLPSILLLFRQQSDIISDLNSQILKHHSLVFVLYNILTSANLTLLRFLFFKNCKKREICMKIVTVFQQVSACCFSEAKKIKRTKNCTHLPKQPYFCFIVSCICYFIIFESASILSCSEYSIYPFIRMCIVLISIYVCFLCFLFWLFALTCVGWSDFLLLFIIILLLIHIM